MKKNYEDYLTLVIDGDLKKRIRIVATMQGKSINTWFNETIGTMLGKIVDEEFTRVTTKIVNDKEKADRAAARSIDARSNDTKKQPASEPLPSA